MSKSLIWLSFLFCNHMQALQHFGLFGTALGCIPTISVLILQSVLCATIEYNATEILVILPLQSSEVQNHGQFVWAH